MELTRVFEFDAAHRVMNEHVKCFNLHGHRYKVEVTFYFSHVKTIGYAIDFKEIKRTLFNYLDTIFDHATILNPLDTELVELCVKNKWKYWLMGLGLHKDINPTAEYIASEIFSICELFFSKETHGLTVTNVRLYETPSCFIDCREPLYNSTIVKEMEIRKIRQSYGDMEYDQRKL